MRKRVLSLSISLGLSLAAGLLLSPASRALETKPSAKTVTFAKDVAAIFHKNCAQCHRPGEAAPFSTLTYKDVRPWAKSIREKVVSREMPPWHADPHFGEFSNDVRLSQAEIDTIVAWVDGGAKEGDPKDLPPAPTFSDKWEIGQPDTVLQMPEEFTLDAKGADDYIYFRVPTNFTEDRWVQAAEFRPGNKRIVHHAVVFVETPQMIQVAKTLAQRNGGKFDPQTVPSVFERAPGPEHLFYKDGTVWRTKMDTPVVNDACDSSSNARSVSASIGSVILTAYAPGKNADVFPAGTAKRIQAGSNLILQMHYSKTTGKLEKDRTSIAFVFAKQPVTKVVETMTIVNSTFAIPPGAENHLATACTTIPRDIQMVNYFPHMHVRGKDMKYEVVHPDGRRETLLSVDRYNFNWQTLYLLKNPVSIPKGSRFVVTAHFDNSTKNKFNPDPTKTVRFGEPTYDEMLVGYADYVRERPKERVVARLDPKLLDNYVGEYHVGPGMNFTITREGDRLILNAPGFGKNEIFPESETIFFLKMADVQLTFSKDDKGEIVGLLIEAGPQKFRAKKVVKTAPAETGK
jgi:mono/diheme cytochrome c family protein